MAKANFWVVGGVVARLSIRVPRSSAAMPKVPVNEIELPITPLSLVSSVPPVILPMPSAVKDPT